MSNLRDRAVLVKVKFRRHGQAVADDTINSSIQQQYGVDHKKTTFHKKVLTGCQAYKDLHSLSTKYYNRYREITVPWGEDERMLSNDRVMPFLEQAGEWQRTLNEGLDKLESIYNKAISEDISNSNGLMKPEDYPTWDEFRGEWGIDVKFYPIPNTEDFRVRDELTEEVREKLVEEGAKFERDAWNKSTKDIWNRMFRAVSHMKNRLKEIDTNESARFHKSVIENIREQVEILKGLNVTGDSSIDEVLDDMQRELVDDTDIKVLKAVKPVREEKLAAIDKILGKMNFGGSV